MGTETFQHVEDWEVRNPSGDSLVSDGVHGKDDAGNLDEALAEVGSRRSWDKSTAKLVCPPYRESEFCDWAKGYVADTCNIKQVGDSHVLLGAEIGSQEHSEEKLWSRLNKITELRGEVECLDDPSIELSYALLFELV